MNGVLPGNASFPMQSEKWIITILNDTKSSLEVSAADGGLVPDSTFFCFDEERNIFVGMVKYPALFE